MPLKPSTKLNIARAFGCSLVMGAWIMIARYFVSGQPDDLLARIVLFGGTTLGTIMVIEVEITQWRVSKAVKMLDNLADALENDEDHQPYDRNSS